MRRYCKTIGGIIACAGVLVVLSLVLPTSFWWFVMGVFLICLGLSIRKRC